MSNDTREEYSVDGLNWIDNEGNDDGMTLFGLPFDPSIYPFKRVRDLKANRVLRFDNLVSTSQEENRHTNSDLATCHPPTICGVESCMNDAYVTLYIGAGEQPIGICPDCLDDLFALQSSVTLPEQRAGVILHYDHAMPGLRFTASIEAGEREGQP